MRNQETLPGYHVGELIHQSSRTRVFRGRTETTGEPVVIKFHNSHYPSERVLASTKRAFEIGRGLDCPGVIRHVALVAHGNDLALITEDYGAVSLDRVIPKRGLQLPAFLSIAIDLADAVGRLHERDVVHKDVKPHNVVMHPTSGVLKVIDFDIASRLRRERTDSAAPEALEGTLEYLSPEQTGRMNRCVDYRSDLYSLGVTLYELLTGRLPFESKDPMELIHCHIARAPVSPTALDFRIPRTVSAIILKLLSKTAEDRYLSAFGAKHDLERCRDRLAAYGHVDDFALGEADVPVRFQLPQKLYGREREMARLLAAFDGVVEGGCALLLVSGYSGVGKSSLVREVQKPIVERRGYFCSGKFDQFRSDLPYVGILEAFRDLLRQLLTERADRIEALRADVLAALGPNGTVVTELLPELELIIGAQPPVPVLGSAESQARFNRVFESFVKVLARPDRPLVLFIDDLQWADLASLQLLEVLSGDRSGGGLLIVGGYRDNEVERGHPLLGTIRRLEDAGHTVGRIQLEPLSESVVAALLADALCVDHGEVVEFAALAHEKTRGNPFFLGEFLQSLHLERLIYLDVGQRRWCWKLDRIRQTGITHNVADLMSRRIEDLGPRTRLVLQLASCIGSAFDLETIAVISDQTLAQTARDLAPALSLDLVLPSDVSYKYVAEFAEVAAERGVASDAINPRYRFLHDRVQQAAHAQLSPRSQREIHLQIGRHLLARVPADRLPDGVIEIVNHLDEGRELLEDVAERLEVARLNLLAGGRAKSAMAIGAAEKYLAAGIELLPADAWRSSYDLALALHSERAEVAYIAGQFDVASVQADLVLEHARELLDRVPIYNVQIGMGVARNEYVEATYRGLEVLQHFGIKFPRSPTTRHILAGLVRTKLVLRGRTPSALVQLPEMTDPQARAAMEILMKTATNAYWGVPNLVPLIAFAMVRLSVRRGNIGLSAYGYALMGMILSAAMGDVEGGYAFGKLASDLIDRTGARELAGKTRLLWDGFIRHVKDPLHDCASAMLDDYHAALDAGDVENAMYCVTVGYYTDFFAGRSLGALAERFEPYLEAALGSQQQQSIQVIGIWTQLVENLAARDRIEPRLVGTRFDHEASLPQFQHARAAQDLAQAGAAAGILAYLLGDVDAARSHFRLVVEHLTALRGQPHVSGILAYYALVLSEEIEQGRAHGDERAVLRRIRRTLRKAARHNPRDYAPLRELVDGEHERICGRHAHAATAFRRTMRQARAAGMVQVEALANERTARLYGATGDDDLERFYLGRASALYRRWGAHAKVAQLERQIGAVAIATPAQLVSVVSEPETGRDEAAGLEGLDFASVMKSLRTLSAEIELDALLERIMDLVIQNAGARRGVLVLERDGTMFVESERSVGDPDAAAARPLDDYRRLPRSILDYTTRTKEPVLLASAADSPLFGRDPYIQAERPRSVLCLPLLRQGQLTGLVYLENDVSAAAFTPKHLTVLEMLCAQAAVSLQNARLYEHQRAMADSFARFVPKQFLQHLGKRSLLDVRLGEAVQSDITVLFSDLRNFTRLSESMSAEDNFALMNGYLARMEPVIQQHDGFIDKYIGDAVMALFSGSADRAVEAAIAMHRALDAYNEHRGAKGRAPLTMGIGVHTGPLMLGTVGSPDRMETTVIGDTVNVASLIESLTRRFGAALLITGETHARLSDAARVSCRIVGRFRMKGKMATTVVYEVVDADGPPARLAKRRTLAAFERGCASYYAGRFPEALASFRECDDSEDRLVQAYRVRCERYLGTHVPTDWDGVEDLESK